MLDELFGGPVAANDNFRKCERCGVKIDRIPKRGPKPRFCSAACRMPAGPYDTNECACCGVKMIGRRRKFCDEVCRKEKRSADFAAAPKKGHTQISGECAVCGEHFVGRAGKVYCGDACARKKRDFEYKSGSRAPERECERCSKVFRRRAQKKNAARFCSRECGVEYLRAASAIVAAVGFTVFRTRCFVCDSPFSSGSTHAKYCSGGCYATINRARSRERNAANDNIDRTPRPCAECGETFSPAYGDKIRKFCSKPCSKRNLRRRGKMARDKRIKSGQSEIVDPIAVFERDKWRCQICGVKTPRKLRGTMDNRAPELDHVMPLSLGGAHSYMNTQCLCRKCNAAKSDTPPSQASLFAYAA